MSETTAAVQVHLVVPSVFRWEIGRAQGYALGDEERCVLVDPLPLVEEELARLGKPEAIILTGPDRQRTAWRYRKQLKVDVFAPEGVSFDEAPDMTYSAGEALPGGLVSFHTPGPWEMAQVLWLTTGPRGMIFLGQLLEHDGSGMPKLVRGLADPARALLSVERIVQRLPADVLCFLEGPPIVGEGARALRGLLGRESAGAHAPT